MAFADAASRLSTLSIPTAFFHHCHSYSATSSPASSPPTSTKRRAAPSQYTPPYASSSSASSGSSGYSNASAHMYPHQQHQHPQQPQSAHQPYPSPPPTMQAFQHALPPLHQQQLPPLSSIVPQSSPFASHHRPQQQRARTRSSGAAAARQHLPAVQPMQPADRPPHSAAFAYPSYGQPGPSSQVNVPVKAPASTAVTIPSNGNLEDQQQARPAHSRQQQHVVANPHTPENRTSRIAKFVAHNTCAMICYIWFADPRPETPSPDHPTSTSPNAQTSSSNPYSPSFPTPESNPAAARLQFCPSKQFVDFMHTLLTTTQVSQGVIVLSLCYIYRLKKQNPGIVAQPGSELRLAVVGLMLANKFLDDNTYTNQTWHQIAKIPLADINNMEREFLGGLTHQLFIDQKAYEGWLLMLNGLMWAKEREFDGWMRVSRSQQQPSAVQVSSSTERRRNVDHLLHPQQTTYNDRPHIHALPRARSTSPIPSSAPASAFPFTFTLPPLQQPSSNPFSAATTPTRPHPHHYHHHQHQPQQQIAHQPLQQLQPPPIPTATRPTTTAGSKRTLNDASFSPDLKPPPAKRPLSGSFVGSGEYAAPVQRTVPSSSYVMYQQPAQQQQPQPQVPSQPQPAAYRIPSASEMMLGVESHSTASSDDSRSSSGEMGAAMMMSGNGGYVDGSGELRAALTRMSLEPSGAGRSGDMVVVKQEEMEEEDEDEEEDAMKEEEDEDEGMDLPASYDRAGSVVEHLIAPYQADERLVSRGLPQYLTFNTLVASPSVMMDSRQAAPQQQQAASAQSQAVVIPPPSWPARDVPRAYGSRDRGKTITRVQVNYPVQQTQQQSSSSAALASSAAFFIPPAVGRSASFAQMGSRSARTSPTGLGYGSARLGVGMDVESFGMRHVSQPHPFQQQPRQIGNSQRVQQAPPSASYGVNNAPTRLPPLQVPQQVIPGPTSTSTINHYQHHPATAPSSHYSSPYANTITHTEYPTHQQPQQQQYVKHQPQGSSFANAGPPGYQWPSAGGFFGNHQDGQMNGYAAAVATPVHGGSHQHQYGSGSGSQNGQYDARWAQGQQAM